MADLIPIKASELPLDNSLSAGEVIFAKGDQLFRVDLARILDENGGGVPSTGKDGLIDGASEHIAGYQFRFIANLYRINGTLYNTVLNTVITFDAADTVLNRIDLVVIELVNSVPQISVIKGVPGNPAPKPLFTNPETQIEFTFVTIFAGTTEAPGIVNTLVYDENLQQVGGEFDTSVIGTGIFLDDTSYPYKGTKAILFENAPLNNSVTFDAGTTITTNNTNLLIKIKLLSNAYVNGIRVSLGGNFVSITNGNFGFDEFNTSNYQSLIIPLSVFPETSFNQIVVSARFNTEVGGASNDLLIDDIVLQSGAFTPTLDDVQWNEITGDQKDVNLSGFTNDLPSQTLQVYSESGTLVGGDAVATIGDLDISAMPTGSGFVYKQNLFDGNSGIIANIYILTVLSNGSINLTSENVFLTSKSDIEPLSIATKINQIAFRESDSTGQELTEKIKLDYSAVSNKTQSFQNKSGTIALKNEEYTVATLPSTPSRGDKAFITDSLSPTYLGVAVGGGAVFCEVMYNGTNWVTI